MTGGSIPDRPSSATPASQLAQRLLRRAAEPIGVIDVRNAQERYQRAIAWPNQHVSRLDRWVGRYGAEMQQGQRAGLTFISRSVGALVAGSEVPLAARATDRVAGNDVLAQAMRDSRFAARNELPVPERARSRDAGSESPDSSRAESRSSAGAVTARSAARAGVEVHVGPAMRAVPLATARSPLISRRASPGAEPVAVRGTDSGTGTDAGHEVVPRAASASTLPPEKESPASERAPSRESDSEAPGPSRAGSRSVLDGSRAHAVSSGDVVVGPAMHAVPSSRTDRPLVSRATSRVAAAGIQPHAESDGAKPIAAEPDPYEFGSSESGDTRTAPGALVLPASALEARPEDSSTQSATPRATIVRASEISRATFPSSHVLVQRRPTPPGVRTTTTDTEPTTINPTPAARAAVSAVVGIATRAEAGLAPMQGGIIAETVPSTDAGTDLTVARHADTVATGAPSMEAGTDPIRAQRTDPIRPHGVIARATPSTDAGTELTVARRRAAGATGAPSMEARIDPIQVQHTDPIRAQQGVIAGATPSIDTWTELTVARRRATVATVATSMEARTALPPGLAAAVFAVSSPSTADRSAVMRSSHPGEPVQTFRDGQVASASIAAGSVPTPPEGVERPAFLSRVTSPLVQRSPAPVSSEIVWRRASAPRIGPAIPDAGASAAGFPFRRPGAAGSAPLPSPAGMISRAIEQRSEGVPSAANATDVASTTSVNAGGSGPDLMQIVEQVTERLLRQIAVERERRGGGRWP